MPASTLRLWKNERRTRRSFQPFRQIINEPTSRLARSHELVACHVRLEFRAARDPLKRGHGGERTSRFHGSSTCIGSGGFLLVAGHGDTSPGDRASIVTQLDARRGYFELNKSPWRTAKLMNNSVYRAPFLFLGLKVLPESWSVRRGGWRKRRIQAAKVYSLLLTLYFLTLQW